METTAEERASVIGHFERAVKNGHTVGGVDIFADTIIRAFRDADKAAGLTAQLAAEKARCVEASEDMMVEFRARRVCLGLRSTAEARAEKAEAALRVAADNLTEASRAVERAANADPQTIARLAFHVQKMAVAARAALGGTP
jgi:hypothetical protein